MSRFIEGEARSQSLLFPERLDDWIEEDNPVRAPRRSAVGSRSARPVATAYRITWLRRRFARCAVSCLPRRSSLRNTSRSSRAINAEMGRDPMYGKSRSSRVQTAFFSVFGANGCFASHSRPRASNVLALLSRSARRSDSCRLQARCASPRDWHARP
jgi:hypothetical protein